MSALVRTVTLRVDALSSNKMPYYRLMARLPYHPAKMDAMHYLPVMFNEGLQEWQTAVVFDPHDAPEHDFLAVFYAIPVRGRDIVIEEWDAADADVQFMSDIVGPAGVLYHIFEIKPVFGPEPEPEDYPENLDDSDEESQDWRLA